MKLCTFISNCKCCNKETNICPLKKYESDYQKKLKEELEMKFYKNIKGVEEKHEQK